MPASMGQAPPSSPFALMGGGAETGDADVQPDQDALLQQIRDLLTGVDEIVGANPSLAQSAQQVKAAMRNMLVQAAQAAAPQTPSGMSVAPTGA